MNYQDLYQAKELLNLSDTATMEEIKTNFRSLMQKWHPDKNSKKREECEEKSKQITLAYAVIMAYCSNYRFDFTEKEFKKHLSGEDWWMERFGNNPVWNV